MTKRLVQHNTVEEPASIQRVKSQSTLAGTARCPGKQIRSHESCTSL